MKFLSSLFRKGVSRLEELKVVEMLAQQVVAAVEQTARMSGEEKKRLALQLLTELLREQGLRPPLLLLDVVLEAAVRLLKPKTESNRQ